MAKQQLSEKNESLINNLFLLNKTEKKKIFNMMKKKHINSLLFYTDYRNLKNIFRNGIRPLKNVELEKNELYFVWSYLQHEESIDLEFDNSRRAYFWKWANDSGMNIDNLVIIAIDPMKLMEQTTNDWFYDSSLKLVSIHEKIPSDSFTWVMVRKPNVVPKIQRLVKQQKLSVTIYCGFGDEIKRTKNEIGETND